MVLKNRNFVVYTVNFYSSPVLFEELVVKQGFGAVGTINPTRENCPKSLASQKKNATKNNMRDVMEFGCGRIQLRIIFGKVFVWLLLYILGILDIR